MESAPRGRFQRGLQARGADEVVQFHRRLAPEAEREHPRPRGAVDPLNVRHAGGVMVVTGRTPAISNNVS